MKRLTQEQKELNAITYAERYGVIDYTIKGNIMTYREEFYGEGTYRVDYNLATKEEKRKLVKKFK